MTPAEMDQYNLLEGGVAWRDLSARGKLGVGGPDRVPFLHAVISNDVLGLADFQGRHGTLLSATGKIQAEFLYYRFPSFVLIDVDPETAPRLLEMLNGYIIMDDVQVEDLSTRITHYAVEGPLAGELVRGLLGIEPPAVPMQVLSSGGPGDPLAKPVVVRRDVLSESGFEILAPADQAAGLRDFLISSGPELAPEVVRVRLIELGIPTFGREFSDRNNPVEVGLESAYSLEKGCYPGQEVVSKAVFVGGVARRLCRLRLEGTRVPAPQAAVHSDGREVGWVVSAAFSPKAGTPLAFAYLKRALAESGGQVEVLLEDGGRAAAVVEVSPAPAGPGRVESGGADVQL